MPVCEAPEVCRVVTRTREMPASEQGGRKEPMAKKFFDPYLCAVAWYTLTPPPTILKDYTLSSKKEKSIPAPDPGKNMAFIVQIVSELDKPV